MIQSGSRSGMIADMGTFRTDIVIENPARSGVRQTISNALVDTGGELSWFPRSVLEQLGIGRLKLWHFRQADGTVLARWTGAANLRVGEVWTVDEVVFGESRSGAARRQVARRFESPRRTDDQTTRRCGASTRRRKSPSYRTL